MLIGYKLNVFFGRYFCYNWWWCWGLEWWGRMFEVLELVSDRSMKKDFYNYVVNVRI